MAVIDNLLNNVISRKSNQWRIYLLKSSITLKMTSKGINFRLTSEVISAYLIG